MNTLSYKTVSANAQTVNKEWVIVDAKEQILGRFSSKVSKLLRGKHKTNFTPHVDCGDNVIVINADKIRMTGKKWTDKKYFSHSGYPGGFKTRTPEEVFAKKPTDLVRRAVRGMLPRNKLGRAIFKNLRIYVGEEHPHQAQEPKLINLNDFN